MGDKRYISGIAILAFLGLVLTVFPAAGSQKADPFVVSQTSAWRTGPVTDKGPASILVRSDIMGPAGQPKKSPDTNKKKASTGETGAKKRPEKKGEQGQGSQGPQNPGKAAEGDGGPKKEASKGKTAGEGPVIWIPDDCGCSPIQPRKARGKGVVTYGFFHKGLDLEKDKKTGALAAKIKFSRINRIGYVSLVYDMEKGFLNYEEWEDNPYVRTALRYNSRVDIVLTFSDSVSQLFANKDKTRVLAADIQRLIKNYGGSGVTVDLRGTSNLDIEVLEGFLKVLREKLLNLDGELFLNLMTGFDPEDEGGPFDGFTIEEVAHMTLSLDLFLVMLAPAEEGGEPVKALFLKLSKLLDRYGLKNNNIEFKDKTLPVLPSRKGADEEIFTQILTVGYGGVGLWPEKGLDDAHTQFISEVFKAHPSFRDMDVVKQILEHFFPGCCKLICPNRHFLLLPTYLLGLMLLTYLVCSFFFCELRTLARTYFKYFLGAVLLLLAMVLGIILCVPFWQGMRTLAVTLLFLLCMGYLIAGIIRRKQQERAP